MTRSGRWLRGLSISLAVIALIAAAGYGLVVRPILLRGEQIGNLVRMRRYVWAIDEYRHQHAVYPPTLIEAIRAAKMDDPNGQILDRWGHQVLYRSTGRGYLLVSYGRDGLPDGTDYESIRASNGRDETPCRNLNADIIFSDRGEHRTCGK